MPNWFLKSVEISGGILPSLSLHFPQGLTCIIDPCGSGKSTLAGALRYGIGGIGRSSDAALAQANLGRSPVTLIAGPQVGELVYTIRRAFNQSGCDAQVAHSGGERAEAQAAAGAGAKPKHFFGSVKLNPHRVSRDGGRIAEEIIQHLTLQPGAGGEVTLEIQAQLPAGTRDNTVRPVTENARTLKFTSHSFEKE